MESLFRATRYRRPQYLCLFFRPDYRRCAPEPESRTLCRLLTRLRGNGVGGELQDAAWAKEERCCAKISIVQRTPGRSVVCSRRRLRRRARRRCCGKDVAHNAFNNSASHHNALRNESVADRESSWCPLSRIIIFVDQNLTQNLIVLNIRKRENGLIDHQKILRERPVGCHEVGRQQRSAGDAEYLHGHASTAVHDNAAIQRRVRFRGVYVGIGEPDKRIELLSRLGKQAGLQFLPTLLHRELGLNAAVIFRMNAALDRLALLRVASIELLQRCY